MYSFINFFSLLSALFILGSSFCPPSQATDIFEETKAPSTVTTTVHFLARPKELSDSISSYENFQKLYQTVVLDNPEMKNNSPYIIGSTLLKNMGINGFGSSLIILDEGFYWNSPVHYGEALPCYHDIRELAPYSYLRGIHGTLVATAAVSKNEKDMAIAFGATVFPTTVYEFKKEDWHDDVYSKTASKERLEEYFWSRKISFGMGNIGWDISTALQSPDFFEGAIGSYMQAIKNDKRLTVPRVLCTSLIFNPSDMFLNQLTTFLETNDMLFVCAGGNHAKTIEKAEIEEQKALAEQFLNKVFAYSSQLASRTLVLGSHNIDITLSTYTNRPGTLYKEHFLFCDGDMIVTLFGKNSDMTQLPDNGDYVRGTSFASPRGAGVATVLGKYFPHFKMTEVKDILLKSAFISNSSDKIIDPAAAWLEALRRSQKSPISFSYFSYLIEKYKFFLTPRGMFF